MNRNFELLQQLQRKLESVPMMGQVGCVAVIRNKKNHSTRIVHFDPNCPTPEEVRKLVENIFLSQGRSAPHLVAFAGLDSGACCSRMIARVAATLARTGTLKVCLVDGYFHSPSLSEFFGFENPFGLIEASRLGASILDFTIPVRDGNLSLLPWGSSEAGVASRLALDQVKKSLDGLRLKFDYVLVNAPPLDQFADGIAFGLLADGLVPVFDRSWTELARALKHLERLRESQVRVCLTVLNYTHFGKTDANASMSSLLYRPFYLQPEQIC